MRSSRIPAFLALAVSLPAAAWDVRTDSEGDVVRWSKSLEMVLDSRSGDKLKDKATEAAVRAAFAHLDEATPFLDMSVRVGEAKGIGYTPGGSNMNSILVLEDWPYSDDALAVTLVTINARTNELLDADVAFNIDSEHQFRVLPETSKNERHYDDIQNTLTHELGHVLGLMHNRDVEDLVMFPSAPPGELVKRALKRDDRDGLLSLYGTEPEAPAPSNLPTVGCSATSSPPVALILGAAMLMFFRRRAAAKPAVVLARARSARLVAMSVAALALFPSVALAEIPAAVSRAEDLALVRVTGRVSAPHAQNPGLIVTELTIAPVQCLKGSCDELKRVVVAGGRVGDLEQFVAHEPVPQVGQHVLVTRTGARVRIVFVEPEVQAEILKAHPSAGSPGTHAFVPPPVAPAKVPAITP